MAFSLLLQQQGSSNLNEAQLAQVAKYLKSLIQIGELANAYINEISSPLPDIALCRIIQTFKKPYARKQLKTQFKEKKFIAI